MHFFVCCCFCFRGEGKQGVLLIRFRFKCWWWIHRIIEISSNGQPSQIRKEKLKSLPNSWGSSWQNTAIEVLIPPETPELPPSAKAAPMANPSLMLWRVSPIIIVHATVEIFLSETFALLPLLLTAEWLGKLSLFGWSCWTPPVWFPRVPIAFCSRFKKKICFHITTHNLLLSFIG